MVKVGTSKNNKVLAPPLTARNSWGDDWGGESLNIKGSTISHVAAEHPGH